MAAAEIAGIKTLKIYNTVNTKMEFKHPNYYKNLRKLARLRNRDEAISDSTATADRERAPRTGQSGKQQAIEVQVIYQDLSGLSCKQQASSTHPDLLPKHGPEYYAPRRRKR